MLQDKPVVSNHQQYYGITHLLVLLGLTGFAIVEPILTIFGSEPSLFLFYNVDSRPLIILYSIVVALAPATLLWVILVVVGLVASRIHRPVYYLVIGLLSGLWFIQLGKWSLGLEKPEILFAFSLLGAVAFVLAYVKWQVMEGCLKVAAIAPFCFIVIFLFFSQTSSLMRTLDLKISRAESGEQLPSLLFIMLDEFPTLALFDERGELDKIRFPNLAELSEEATWYRHYSVLSDMTDYSVPSILTGNEPVDIPPTFANFPKNIFTLLAPTHFLTVFETLTDLCGLSQCSEGSPGTNSQQAPPQWGSILWKTYSLLTERISLEKPAAPMLDDFAEKMVLSSSSIEKANEHLTDVLVGVRATKRAIKKPKRLQAFIDSFVPDPKPALYFLHIEMPHIPWRFYGTGESYDVPRQRTPFSGANDDGGRWLTQLSEYRFFLQAKYTDKLLGEVFDRMKSLGVWDELLVIVTADHGRSFRPDVNSRTLQQENIDGIAYAPLFVKRPYQRQGRVDDSNMMSYDLVPTITDILGVEVPHQFDGLPAGDVAIIERGDQKVFFTKKDKGQHFTLTAGAVEEFDQKIVFSDTKHYPNYSTRWIAAAKDASDPISLLNSRLELDGYWGRSPEKFEILQGGGAVVDELSLLKNPPTDRPPLGVVMGNLDFATEAQKVLIAVNGHFVTGSPLVTFRGIPNTFIAMLPYDTVSMQKEIGVYLVGDSGLLQLKLD